MSCNQSDLSPIAAPSLGTNQTALLRAFSQGPRRLMVSDNPESVSSNDPAVLWQHTQQAEEGVTQFTHRVFMWHENPTGESTKKIGLTIENLGTATLQVSGTRETGVGGNYYTVGHCLAKATLGNTQDSFTPVDSQVAPGDVGLIEEFNPWNSGTLRAAIYHLTISAVGEGTLSYRLRTAFGTTTTNLRTLTGGPMSPSGTHPRGSWVDSEILTTFQIDIIGDPFPLHFRLSEGAAQSADFLFKAVELGSITIPADSTRITEFKLMTGGNSSLPVAIILSAT